MTTTASNAFGTMIRAAILVLILAQAVHAAPVPGAVARMLQARESVRDIHAMAAANDEKNRFVGGHCNYLGAEACPNLKPEDPTHATSNVYLFCTQPDQHWMLAYTAMYSTNWHPQASPHPGSRLSRISHLECLHLPSKDLDREGPPNFLCYLKSCTHSCVSFPSSLRLSYMLTNG